LETRRPTKVSPLIAPFAQKVAAERTETVAGANRTGELESDPPAHYIDTIDGVDKRVRFTLQDVAISSVDHSTGSTAPFSIHSRIFRTNSS
jgi:hypothetical protein